METTHMIILLVVLTVFIRWVMYPTDEEGFLGSMTQLHSRGPQDINLTVNSEKYLHGYGNRYPYDRYIWNNPTRYRRPYYYYDYNYHLYPFFYWWY